MKGVKLSDCLFVGVFFRDRHGCSTRHCISFSATDLPSRIFLYLYNLSWLVILLVIVGVLFELVRASRAFATNAQRRRILLASTDNAYIDFSARFVFGNGFPSFTRFFTWSFTRSFTRTTALLWDIVIIIGGLHLFAALLRDLFLGHGRSITILGPPSEGHGRSTYHFNGLLVLCFRCAPIGFECVLFFKQRPIFLAFRIRAAWNLVPLSAAALDKSFFLDLSDFLLSSNETAFLVRVCVLLLTGASNAKRGRWAFV